MSGNEWQKIEPGVWKPENKGDSIIGVLISKEPKTEDSSARYNIENQDGIFLVWGTTILDDRLRHVQIGQKLKIVFNGKTKNKRGQDLNLYEVAVAKNPKNNQVLTDLKFKNGNELIPAGDIL